MPRKVPVASVATSIGSGSRRAGSNGTSMVDCRAPLGRAARADDARRRRRRRQRRRAPGTRAARKTRAAQSYDFIRSRRAIANFVATAASAVGARMCYAVGPWRRSPSARCAVSRSSSGRSTGAARCRPATRGGSSSCSAPSAAGTRTCRRRAIATPPRRSKASRKPAHPSSQGWHRLDAKVFKGSVIRTCSSAATTCRRSASSTRTSMAASAALAVETLA